MKKMMAMAAALAILPAAASANLLENAAFTSESAAKAQDMEASRDLAAKALEGGISLERGKTPAVFAGSYGSDERTGLNMQAAKKLRVADESASTRGTDAAIMLIILLL